MFGWCKGAEAVDVESGGRFPNGVAENHSDSGVLARPPWLRGKASSSAAKPAKNVLGLRNGNRIVPMLSADMCSSSPEQQTSSTTGPSRNYTGEELVEFGFPLYSRSNVATALDVSDSQPFAFLAVETEPVFSETAEAVAATSQLRGASVTSASGRDASFHQKHNNKVVPVFTNAACEGYFEIGSFREYGPVIRKLLKRDPLLTFAIQKALRSLKVAEQKPVNHVTPDPSGQTCTLFGMRLTPCVWREEDTQRLTPSLLVEHNVPYNPAEIMPRLMRDYAVLSHVPAILTLIDFQGKVLYQNASSLAYMGDLLSAKYDKRLSMGLLRVLFAYDPYNLEQLLEDVLGGEEWQGVVQVPYSLRRYLAAQPDEVPSHLNEDSFSSQGSTSAAASAPLPRVTAMNDELEVQFQIGNSFTTRGLVGMHKKGQQQLGSKPGIQNLSRPSGTGGPEVGASFMHTQLPSVPDSSPDGHRSSQSSKESHSFSSSAAGPSDNMPQNRIRSLLAKAKGNEGGGNGSVRFKDDQGGVDGPTFPQFMRQDDPEEGYDEQQECYHEVHAIPLLDPVLDKQVVMLVETDVTPRVELENRLADLTEAQLSMLGHMFPRHIIEYMLARVPKQGSRGMKDLANTHDQVMVLFCDVVGFTSMSKEVEPNQVLNFLNELYEVFDDLLDEYGMYKLDIVGDCYIVVAGLIKEDQDGFVCVDEMDEDQITSNAVRIMQFAKAVLRSSQKVLMPHNSESVKLRIGIHTGKLVSGLIGSKMPKFTLFGDTMNTASRMESTCRVGCVHVSDTFGSLLPYEDWESTGGVEVKGKGLMQTLLWVPNSHRQELVDLEPENALPKLRQMLTMASFTSTKSRALHDFGGSYHTGRGSRSGPSYDGSESSHHPGRNSNALMAILQNIRGGDGDDLESPPGVSGQAGPSGHTSTQSTARPKSAYQRAAMSVHRQRTKDGSSRGGVGRTSASGVGRTSASGVGRTSASGVSRISTSGVGRTSASGVGRTSASGISGTGTEEAGLSWSSKSASGSQGARRSGDISRSPRRLPSQICLDDRKSVLQVARRRSGPKKSVNLNTANNQTLELNTSASYEPLNALSAVDLDRSSLLT